MFEYLPGRIESEAADAEIKSRAEKPPAVRLALFRLILAAAAAGILAYMSLESPAEAAGLADGFREAIYGSTAADDAIAAASRAVSEFLGRVPSDG